jgi:hypothetical protein
MWRSSRFARQVTAVVLALVAAACFANAQVGESSGGGQPASPLAMEASVAPTAMPAPSASRGPTPRYYFSSSGSDSNRCTSPSAPCQTLRKLASLPLKAGDVVGLKRGDRFAGTLTLTNWSGTPQDPITLTTYGAGALPIIDGEGAGSDTRPMDAFTIAGRSSWVVVDSIHIQNVHNFAVRLADTTSHVLVQNSELGPRLCGGVAMGKSRFSRVIGNYIHDLTQMCSDVNGACGTPTGYGGEAVDVGGDDQEVGHNKIIGARSTCGDGSCLEIFGDVHRLKYHHNWCESGGDVVEAAVLTATSDVEVSQNVFIDPSGGVCLHTRKGGIWSNYRYHNNTFVFGPSAHPDVGLFACMRGGDGTAVLSVKNNIFYLARGQYLAASGHSTQVRGDYNIYWWENGTPNFANWTAGAHDLARDPLFVNRLSKDYRLQAGSPAIGSGTRLDDTVDGEAVRASTGAGPDRGAF